MYPRRFILVQSYAVRFFVDLGVLMYLGPFTLLATILSITNPSRSSSSTSLSLLGWVSNFSGSLSWERRHRRVS